MDEADASFQQFPKPDGWNRDPRQICSIRTQSHKAGVDGLEQLLSPPGGLPPGKFQPVELLRGHAALAQLHAFVGELDKSIAEWKLAYQIAQSSVPNAIPYLQESLGTTYLHLSETENGIYRDSGSQDIFPPLNPGASYQKQQNSELAVQYFQSYLTQKPDDQEVKWLLNLAYMTLGKYPAKGCRRNVHLIPLSRFRSRNKILGETSPTLLPAPGWNVFSEAGGVLVDDFDNDRAAGRGDIEHGHVRAPALLP